MTAIREQIFALIEQRLGAIEGLREIERMPSGDPAKFPAIHIFDAPQAPEEEDAGSTRYALTCVVEGYVAGAGGAAAHAALNALYNSVVELLMTEPPLDGLAETISEGGFRPQVVPLADKRRLAFSLEFNITFPTRRGSPAAMP